MSLDFKLTRIEPVEIYSKNITHNLIIMAELAGLYNILWRPKENGYFKASDIIIKLEKGIKKLKSKPEYFKKYNPKNGWGSYEIFLCFCESLLQACKENKESDIETYI